MIEGTRRYKGDQPKTAAGSSEPSAHSPAPAAAEAPPKNSDAVNLERREWFQSLVPAFGEGLVKLLRVSNNLQQELHESLRAKAHSFTREEKDET